MSNKRKGQITVSGEWAKHLRPFFRRVFWKQERQAAQNLVRLEVCGPQLDQNSACTVESLLVTINALPVECEGTALWVPAHVTLEAMDVESSVVMGILTDTMLARGLFPNGFTPGLGGKWYHYRKE